MDRLYGLPPKATLSQRDVPGLTAAAIPLLLSANVTAISVGVNSGSTVVGSCRALCLRFYDGFWP